MSFLRQLANREFLPSAARTVTSSANAFTLWCMARKREVARSFGEVFAERRDATGHSGKAERDNQLHHRARAARFAGRLSGTDPLRSEKARARVRARLAERIGRDLNAVSDTTDASLAYQRMRILPSR